VKPLWIHEKAEEEVQEAIAYYDAQYEGLGCEFREDLESAFARLRMSPGAPTPIDAQASRKIRCRRFPYTIYYIELDQTIWIAAIAHQKRRRGYWTGRQP
jgi:toxin ParE1/3/4